MPAYSLFLVTEPHDYRATPEGRASAALRDPLDHHEHGYDAADQHVAAACHPVATVDAEPRANELTPTPAPITKARSERGTESTRRDGMSRPVAGPSARLRALPQATADQLTTPDGIDNHLAQLEKARQAQLDALPAAPGNVVAAAHQETVEWILKQVRTARQRLREDVYGICARCGALIPPDRLAAQPWVITCTVCDPPDRPVLSPVPTPGR
ncbi:hypothetical protein ASC64_09420 [Nocardioides sp. Root122]|uniref:TraR/DksA family transcriptional regulator n=1 Tax=Nocardioides TaxID=1839 RepID=UPI000702DB0A|nr:MULTISPECIES: TraR/DksA C4-type zinc finger protein [Nocardioides]KQV69994.1 hypothetical protein ASC64_09420 [Nocardioides sp. Root122]MCK9825028.1 TraR/DksA C4-type zinc finger protein [Nocardioides cavernae]